jgi:hypothetical protein
MRARFRISPIAYYISLALMLVATSSHAAPEEQMTELAPMQVTADAEQQSALWGASHWKMCRFPSALHPLH